MQRNQLRIKNILDQNVELCENEFEWDIGTEHIFNQWNLHRMLIQINVLNIDVIIADCNRYLWKKLNTIICDLVKLSKILSQQFCKKRRYKYFILFVNWLRGNDTRRIFTI